MGLDPPPPICTVYILSFLLPANYTLTAGEGNDTLVAQDIEKEHDAADEQVSAVHQTSEVTATSTILPLSDNPATTPQPATAASTTAASSAGAQVTPGGSSGNGDENNASPSNLGTLLSTSLNMASTNGSESRLHFTILFLFHTTESYFIQVYITLYTSL